MRRSVGAALTAAALLLICAALHPKGWVCLKIHGWKEYEMGVGPRVGSALGTYPSPIALHCCPLQNIFFSIEYENRG